jgi:penicillin-binding protein 1A
LGDVYEPRNYNDQYGAVQWLGNGQKLREQRMTIARALERSSNVIAVQVLDKLGILPVVRLANRMGISVRREMGLCIALGCSETTLLDLTAAYSSFSNGGLRTRPVFIRKITNMNGDLLYEHIPDPPEEVLSPWTAFQMRNMLSRVITNGTGRRARLKRPAGGKTGTNDGPRDAWFIGFTSELVAGVWIGNDDNRDIPGETGGRTPARMWKKLMISVESSDPPRPFPVPDAPYVSVRTCPVSGQVANPSCPWPVNYYYREDAAPARVCEIHGVEKVALRSAEAAQVEDPEYTTTNPYVSRLREAFGEPDPKVNQPSP